MIRVRIEMCPRGDEAPDAVREIGRMYIANVGGNTSRGDYDVAVCRRGATDVPLPVDPNGPKPTRAGHVEGYPRLAYNVWRLITRACLASFPEEAGTTGKGVYTLLTSDVIAGLQNIAAIARSVQARADIQWTDNDRAALAFLDAATLNEGGAT